MNKKRDHTLRSIIREREFARQFANVDSNEKWQKRAFARANARVSYAGFSARAFTRKTANVPSIDETQTCIRTIWDKHAFGTLAGIRSIKMQTCLKSIKTDRYHTHGHSLEKTQTCIRTTKRKCAFARWNAKVHSREKNANMNSLNESQTCTCTIKRKRAFGRENANVHSHN